MVSPMVADAIIGRFPTLASLCTQFETGDTTLLADILVQRPGSAPRAVGRATSTRIYQVLMGSDPNMLVE